MKTHFHIENESFDQYFKLTLDGKEYYFSDELTVEHDHSDSLTFHLEIVHPQDYFKRNMKNPLLRLAINLLKWILFAVIYFVDNQNGIGLHKGYHGFDPFAAGNTFSVISPDGKTVSIRYTKPVYHQASMTYKPPVIECMGESVMANTPKNAFSPTALLQEWNAYHVPAFTLVSAVLAALGVLMVYACVKVFGALSAQGIWAALGVSACALAIMAIIAWYIRTIIKACKLRKQVIKNNTAE